jgi:hypothetical protein
MHIHVMSLLLMLSLNYLAAKPISFIDSVLSNGHKINIDNLSMIEVCPDSNYLEFFISPLLFSNYSHYSISDVYGSNLQKLHYPYIKINIRQLGLDTLNIGKMQNGEFKILNKILLTTTKSTTINETKAKNTTDWVTMSMYLYGSILLGSGFFFYILYNLRRKLQMERVRNNIASDLHDEVGSNLSSIAMFTKVLERMIPDKSKEIEEVIDKIKDSSFISITNLRDTVWSINPENDKLIELFSKLETFGKSLFSDNSTNVQFKVLNENPEEINLIKLDMNQRRNLYLIIKEAMHNVGKHAHAKNLIIQIQKSKDRLLVSIKDDGKGIPEEYQSGLGLQSMKNRAEKNDFGYNLISNKNGTTIKIDIESM